MEKEQFIVHVDMDAFFASIEQRDHPEHQGKPVIVGADPQEGRGRGVVSACSYEARKFGIHSALPISTAYKLCPQAIFLPVDMKKYIHVSRQVFQILETFTPDIEPISIDEAFLDISHSFHLFGTPVETCRKIKKAVKEGTGLNASLGLAPNMMTAKIASDLEKPDGFVVVTQAGLQDFLFPLPVEKLWGIGRKTREVLKPLGISTVGDLARLDASVLIKLLGKHGDHIRKLANGIDPREVVPSLETKSIGNEHTFNSDISDRQLLLDTLMALSENVSRRMRKKGLKGKTVTLKIRFEDFTTYTRSVTLPFPTNFIEDIYGRAAEKCQTFDINRSPVRLIGVQVSNLADSEEQPSLFHDSTGKNGKREKLHEALDIIKDKFGDRAILHRRKPPE
ncbi:MAG: DNA polymerase IV [Candidatus Aminicenantes bacterium]|nr:DNA polymerase IV [Candidatus Aminicenantes bacterium]